ncbi:MAG TPA: tRNA (N6-isopentenyl adenosine(37)-C2)-methylthiotransferase MiaB [Polyangiales bacterium]|nr:tRNA (N6-isopentenyl adenosine(37)-C2)-methylthiotransferase MiaB [Polyangiales bacterium]
MRRYLIQTFGCQMNVHDSLRIEEALSGAGYEATDAPELADLIVFNTCSIREKADHKLRSAAGTFRELKERKRDLVMVVAGCMAQQRGDALLKEVDLVDVVIGPDNIAELPSLIGHVRAGGPPIARTVFDLEAPSFLQAHAKPLRQEACAYVTIMKGCDERCTYCIVPYTRGAERYRSSDEIVAEVQRLCAAGVREITLLGQTVNSWHEPHARASESQFPWLLRRIAKEVPELWRLRYTSPHPRHVTPALIAAHAELQVLPAHVHLPVQSGSDRMLRMMLRRYRRQDFLQRVAALKSSRPGFTLSTDMIVGFPDETEQDFQDTLSLVREAGFVSVFAFKYSPRPHTPALRLGDTISEELKSERLERLFAVSDAQQAQYLASLVGRELEVLIEGPSKSDPTRYTGRSERHEIVHVAVPRGVDPTGQLVRVRAIEANKRSLVAEPLQAWPAATSDTPFSPSPQRKSALRLPVVPV